MNAISPDKPNILLVDDRPENLTVLEELLGTADHNLVCARSGEEALKQVLNTDFAAILLDVQMPGIDGFETAELIRQRRQSAITPIIFITAGPQTNEKMLRGYSLGAVDFLFKPIIPEILKAKTKAFVNLFTMRREIESNARRMESVNAQLTQEITERTQAQTEVLKLNRFLEDKIQELALSNKELEAFSYSVSHDLRAPLRSMDGFSLMLLEEYSEKMDDTAKGYLIRIRDASQRMGQIIDDLLRLSRIIRSDLRMGPVDLSLLVQGISDTCRNASPDRNVEMIIAPHVRVMADTNLLQIALENLIGNAWKFTRKAADPRIEFGVCDQADSQRSGEITCFIKDNGVGFDMAMADRLFTPFQRLHPQSEFSGTGIGLAIVHRIIAKHGGRIWAEAEVGGGAGAGAVFYFTLKNAEC